MKSLFSRILTTVISLLIVNFILIGAVVQITFKQQILSEKESELKSAAEEIAKLSDALENSYTGDEGWLTKIALADTAKIAGISAFLTDNTGCVKLKVTNTSNQSEVADALPENIVSAVSKTGYFFAYGNADGFLPEDTCFICISAENGDGFILVNSEEPLVSSGILKTSGSFFVLVIVLVLCDIAVVSFFAKREAKPIKELAAAEKEFGHGNLQVRYVSDDNVSEEIAELTTAFNNMATSIEKSEIRRREFVANVGHELKTPMTTIAGFMDGMIDGTIPDEQHVKYMTIVSNEVRRLSRLVQSMLETSRIQDQGIPESRKKQFDICELIARTLLSFEQKINAKHVNVDVQMPELGVSVWAAEDMIAQVVYNLFDNAVKFCNTDGNLFVQVNSDGQKVSVSIANSGPVIPPEELPLVFDRFHKTDKSRSIDKEGAGLGLYIVKTIITAHQEDISVTSRDEITRFSFTLPAK